MTPRGTLGEKKQEFSPFPINFFYNNQKTLSWNLRVHTPYKMRRREEVGFPISRHIVDIPVVIKAFKFY